MESKSKRSRTPNWDSSDKILLRQLIEDKIEIIENKNVDTNTSRIKRDAWREITHSFNSLSATIRETSQIQAQWRGTKMKARAEMSAFPRNLRATGGGSFKRKINCKDSELLKNELFQFAMANRRAEKEFMQLEHDEKMKSIIMEREIKLKTLNMEHLEREKMLEMERRHTEEIHQLKMRKLEEHFSL
ncbi:STE20-like serine/threonine-protein kinase [Eupeodes corollae]|uniref:STE20-like serine/threonine-protein kinase n=1 Tax=Eupeodes corollae TaxID=290404 RepID=UPI00248FAA17|nr:STE20-like serine/threonine-protein kinase [Eupeodes corollae]